MASKSFSEENLSCPVCCDIFKNPVLMRCSHSICKECLERFWQSKGSRECPICRKKCGKDQPPTNLVLKNLCESFIQERKLEGLCVLHRKKLTFFCLEDNQPVCVACRHSKKHNGHTCNSLNKTALDCKEKLDAKLKPLRKKLRKFENAKLTCDQTAAHIKAQAEKTEKQIKKEFEKLHQFLRDEEAARIAALREEEEQKSQMMKETIEKMSRETSTLSDTIRAIEEQMGADDLTLLQNYTSTVERAQCTLLMQNPQKVSGPVIYVAKHLDNMSFKVWEKMQEIVKYTPVTLDPNTAHPDLILSEDLTSVKCNEEEEDDENYDDDEDDYDDDEDDYDDDEDDYDDDDDEDDYDDEDEDDDDEEEDDEDCKFDDSDERQQLPDNPERFNEELAVLGSEGFNSGTHCWDVKIKGNEDWVLGLMAESANRKGNCESSAGLWYVSREDGHYYAFSAQRFKKRLRVRHRLKRIRVKVDCYKGNMAFTDPVHNIHLFTFTHKFTEKVYPYFSPDIYMRISPGEISVMVE